MSKLGDIKVGDEVAVSQGGMPRDSWSRATVEKITATQVTAGGNRYNRRNGVRIGHGGAHWSATLAPMSPWHEEQIAATQRRILRHRLQARMGRSELTIGQLRRIEAIMQEGKG